MKQSFVDRYRLARPFAVFGGTLALIHITGLSHELPAFPSAVVVVVLFAAMVAIRIAMVKRREHR